MTPGTRDEVDISCWSRLTSISLLMVKGTDLLWETPLTRYRPEGSFIKGLVLPGPNHALGKFELWAKGHGPGNNWSSSAPRAGIGSGFPPPKSLELLIPGSALAAPPACPLVLGTLPHPCSRSYQSPLVIFISLNWLVLVAATCKPNTLTVKAEHWQICIARVRWDILKIFKLLHFLSFQREKDSISHHLRTSAV